MNFATKGKITEQKIISRKKFLGKTIDFSFNIIAEIGKRTFYEQGSSHTHTRSELRDFEGFSFFLDTGQTMMGGNDIEITYNDKLVLKVYWHACFFEADGDDYRVEVFNCDTNWQSEISRLIRNKTRAIARKAKKEEKINNKARKEIELELKEKSLLGEAERLKLS